MFRRREIIGGVRVFAARGKRLCCRSPTPAIRSPINILMVTMMALVWTVNSTLSWGCNYVMQRNLGWSVATAKTKTAAHTFCTCLCWNKVMYITLFSIQQMRPNFRIPYFCPSRCRPLHSAARGRWPLPPSPPPFLAASESNRSWVHSDLPFNHGPIQSIKLVWWLELRPRPRLGFISPQTFSALTHSDGSRSASSRGRPGDEEKKFEFSLRDR